MMAVTEGKIRVTADTSDAQRALGNLEKALDNLKGSTGAAAKAFAAITGAAAGIAYVVKQTVDAAGSIMDAANAIGVSASSLNTLQTAAGLAGVGAEQLNSSLIKLNKSIGEGLSKGTGPAVDGLKKLGVPIAEIARMRPDQQFTVLAQKLNEIQNPAQRTAAAMELFGKQGPQILAVANELEKVRQITDAIGFGLSDRELQSLDEASDSLDQLRVIWDAGIKKAVAEVAPYIVAMVNKIKEGIVAAGGFDGIWQKIKSVANTVLNIMLAIAAVMAIRMVAAAIAFAGHLARALVTARGISAVLARTPVGLLTAGLTWAADKLGIDIVGGFTDALDLSLDLKGAQDQINQALDDKNASLETGNDLAKEFNDEQNKAKDALDETANKIRQQTEYLRDVVALGEDEANINKLINEEKAKLAKVGLEITDAQVNTLRTAQQELQASQLLTEEKKKQRALVDEYYNAALKSEDKLIQEIRNYGDLKKAMEAAYKQAGRPMEDPVQGITYNAARDGDMQSFQRSEVYRTGVTAQQAVKRIQLEVQAIEQKYNEVAKLDAEYQKAVQVMDDQLFALKQAGFTEEVDAYRIMQEAKLSMEREYQQKILQAQVNRISQTLSAERNAIAQSLSERDKEVLQRAGAEERQKAIVAERIAFEKKSDVEKAAFAIDQGAQMFSALGAQNKKAFEAAKAFNIANAIMNTYMAATKALATYPPPFNFIAAAAAVGMGLAQVAQIRSQQYSGRALGGPVMGGQSYIVGESGPELFTPNTTGSITRNGDLGGGGEVSVNFTINAVDTAGFDELLISRRGLITQVISDAMVEKGQRGL
jgi:hypothetical protein